MPIPKKFFTYWEGDQLSILHYYTIYSLNKYNPDIDITIYTSNLNAQPRLIQWTTNEHRGPIIDIIPFSSLQEINPHRIKIIPIDFTSTYGVDNNISVVFKADFVRIAKLYEHGGMWFDMDILFIKPIPEYLFNSDTDFYYYTYQGAVPTGLLFVSPEKHFLKDLCTSALSILKGITSNASNNYQVLGPLLWGEHLPQFTRLCIAQCLKTSDVYPYDCETIPQFYTDKNMIEENTFGIHWYNGHPMTKAVINTLDIGTLDDSCVTVIEKMLYNVIHK